jgi:hypothetical protein
MHRVGNNILQTTLLSRCGRLVFLLGISFLCVSAYPAFAASNVAGVTLAGSSGLLTVPVPDTSASGRSFALKYNRAEGKAKFNNQPVSLSKNEGLISVRNKFDDEVEGSLIFLAYDRKSLPQLTGSVNHCGIGFKVTPRGEERDFCYGFNYTPMNTHESMLADIEQIESLRNVYATFVEQLSPRITGYLNLAAAFAGRQRIEFSDGSRRDVKRNDIYTGTFAAACRFRDRFQLIGEFKIGHYRNMLVTDETRYRLHAAVRFDGHRFNYELAGYNLNDSDPVIGVGGNMKF